MEKKQLFKEIKKIKFFYKREKYVKINQTYVWFIL